MLLQFIDQTPSGVGSPDRRLIRSHVMRGKNRGKFRPSSKRQGVLDAQRSAYVMPQQVLWNDLCLASFPQELDSESTALMHRWFFDVTDALFPPQFCTEFDSIKSIWVDYILSDEAYFHITLAISASYMDFFARKPAISTKALHHISEAASSTRDGNGAFARALSHIIRLDIELAIQAGIPPLFRAEEVPIHPILCNPDVSSAQFPDAVPRMPPIMLDLLSFSKLLNEVERKRKLKLDALDYTETHLSLLYRLVGVTPLQSAYTPSSPRGGLYSDVIHFAMLAFMSTLLPEYTRDQSTCPLLSYCLESAVGSLCISESEVDQPTLLWILFIGGISVLDPREHYWLSSLILDTCKTLRLDDWAAIQGGLSRFPWIFVLHEAPGRRLWEDVRRGNGSRKRSGGISSLR